MNNFRKFYFAIRHKPSGGFLPQMAAYGFTRTSPSLDEPPRLFTTKKGCEQSLRRWLEGEWYEGQFNDETQTQDVKIIKVPSRRAIEMEIVEIEISARTLTEAELRRL